MRALRQGGAFFALLLALLLARAAQAQEGGRAGLVIVTGAGEPITRCVEFEGESISGYELLVEAGVAIVSEQVAMGASICSLEGVGCAYPADSCFCQCQGSPCVYWSYWRQDEAGVWQYAHAGAGSSTVRDGDVEGWVWGPGTEAETGEPPALSFADLCAAPAASTPLTATLATTSVATASVTTTTTTTAAPAAAAMPLPAPAPQAADNGGVASRTSVEIDLRTLGLLALVVLLPLGALALLRRRRI